MEGRSRIEPFLRAMATLARAVGSDLEDYLVSLGLPPDSEPPTPVSSQEQLEAARAILAITARLPVVNANAVGEVTAEELLETPVDELSARAVGEDHPDREARDRGGPLADRACAARSQGRGAGDCVRRELRGPAVGPSGSPNEHAASPGEAGS